MINARRLKGEGEREIRNEHNETSQEAPIEGGH